MTHKEQKDWTENVRWADDSQALLDDFAKAAMQAIIGTMPHPQHPNWGGKEGAAYHAYEIATMMMKERERRMKG